MRRLIITTLPKSGTHLVDGILGQVPPLRRIRGLRFNNCLRWHPFNFVPFMGDKICPMGVAQPHRVKTMAVRQQLARVRPGTYGVGHIPYSDEMDRLLQSQDFHRAVMIRDPRAVTISQLHYVLRKADHYLHRVIGDIADDADRIKALIHGMTLPNGARHLGIAEQIDSMLPWIQDTKTLTLHFETLIGAQGGGDDTVQREQIGRLAAHAGCSVSEEDAARIGHDVFGRGKTFRCGQIDDWQTGLQGSLRDELESTLGDRLALLGYA
jgi:hypothetical protein